MNETNGEHERIERLLKQARLPEPSDPLKDRVTASARQAWGQSTTDIPWRIPLRRLALSAAAAVLIVSLANHFSDFSTPGTRSNCHSVMPAEVPTPEILPEASYRPLMNRLVQTGRRSIRTDVPALHRYMKNVQKILSEMEAS